MNITKIQVENFRLLKDFSLDLNEELSLVIGKNNTGKTSILTVLDKFLNEKSKFSYDDFNLDFRKEFEEGLDTQDTNNSFLNNGIKLRIYIQYNDNDDLSHISKLIMDLDPENNTIVLGFEYIISEYEFKILKNNYKVNQQDNVLEKSDFLKQEFTKYFKYYKKSIEYNTSKCTVNDEIFVDLNDVKIDIKKIINFKYISAKREVTNKEKEKTLSKQTSNLYKKLVDNQEKISTINRFKEQLLVTDKVLNSKYMDIFEDVISKVKSFGGFKEQETIIEIISTLQHSELLEGNSTVVYTHGDYKLPEHYNGLGLMNLINIIFEIEILLQEFRPEKDNTPSVLNLLFIEEPEAHTHPQMQYVFIKNIKKLLKAPISPELDVNFSFQYVITTHSSHIVTDCDFEDIIYLKTETKNSVKAKNLTELINKYEADPKHFQFLKQYLTISRAEIFFADKAILIEGDTERILLPTIMRKMDLEELVEINESKKHDTNLPLLSQNISVIEVGAYSHIFEHFINFLGVKSLLITDIDSVDQDKKACPVSKGIETSNIAIKHFLKDIDFKVLKHLEKINRIINFDNSDMLISYQQVENSYHARSFEDAFICINKQFIKENLTEFKSLKNCEHFKDDNNNPYELASKCIKKKTHFALDIIYCSNGNFTNWEIPAYIKEGLEWLKIG